jgi:hypothetical protein
MVHWPLNTNLKVIFLSCVWHVTDLLVKLCDMWLHEGGIQLKFSCVTCMMAEFDWNLLRQLWLLFIAHIPCTCVRTCTSYVCVCVCVCVLAHVWVCVCVCVCAHVGCVYVSVRMYSMSACTCICMHAHIWFNLCVCVCVCVTYEPVDCVMMELSVPEHARL